MKLTIFAATGGIGRQALEQAVAAGHEVTAVVRNPQKVSGEVRIVRADLAAPVDRPAVDGRVPHRGRTKSPRRRGGFGRRRRPLHAWRDRTDRHHQASDRNRAMKKSAIIYWTSTGIIAFSMLASAYYVCFS